MYKSVTVYSTPTCPYCRVEKQWLEKNKIPYKNIFVDEDEKAADEMIKKSKQMGVPVTEVITERDKSQIIVGFDKRKLSQALGIKE